MLLGAELDGEPEQSLKAGLERPGHGELPAFTAAVKQERRLLVNPLFRNLLCKFWFDSLRAGVAVATKEALRMSFCIRTIKVDSGSLNVVGLRVWLCLS